MVEGVGPKANLRWDEKDGDLNCMPYVLQQNECTPSHIDERLWGVNKRQKIDSASATGFFGLKLKKTKSLLDLVEMKLFNNKDAPPNERAQSADLENDKSRNEICVTQQTPEKLKASNFPATLLRIGQWERTSQNEGDIVGKCYFAKRRLVWETLYGKLKRKIEIPWSEISAIRATFADGRPSILEVELKKPPEFYHETNPQPRKHTNWASAEDFTSGQAQIYRRHYLEFPEGTLEKNYKNLLHYDNRLLTLSQRPFPSSSSPYFAANGTTQGFPFDLGMRRSNFLPVYNPLSRDWFPNQVPHVSHPRTITTARNIGVYEPLSPPSMNVAYPSPFLKPTVGVMGVNSPSSVIDFSPSKETRVVSPMDPSICHSATNFLSTNGYNAINRVAHEPTPIWDQQAQHQVSVYDAMAPRSRVLPSGTGHAMPAPDFLPQRVPASNLSPCTAAMETAHSNDQRIVYIEDFFFDDPPTGPCSSDEQTLMADVNSIECLNDMTTQLDSQPPENSNIMQDERYMGHGENPSDLLNELKQSMFVSDMNPAETLIMDLPSVTSNPFWL